MAPREARGLVITMYRSTAITIKVIMLQIPNSAPQKAYISQAAGGKAMEGDVSTFADVLMAVTVRIILFSVDHL